MDREPSASARLDPARERDLVARARVDPGAFGELYDHYLPRIHAFLVRRLGDRTVAEDVTAMVFERALGAVRSDDFRNASFGGWLFRVATNAAVDHVRRSRRVVPLGRRASDLGPDDEADERLGDDRATRAFDAAIDRDVLRRALAAMSTEHRRLLVLRYLDGLTTEELCAVLGCSPATLAVRHHRALRAMRARLTAEASDVA